MPAISNTSSSSTSSASVPSFTYAGAVAPVVFIVLISLAVAIRKILRRVSNGSTTGDVEAQLPASNTSMSFKCLGEPVSRPIVHHIQSEDLIPTYITTENSYIAFPPVQDEKASVTFPATVLSIDEGDVELSTDGNDRGLLSEQTLNIVASSVARELVPLSTDDLTEPTENDILPSFCSFVGSLSYAGSSLNLANLAKSSCEDIEHLGGCLSTAIEQDEHDACDEDVTGSFGFSSLSHSDSSFDLASLAAPTPKSSRRSRTSAYDLSSPKQLSFPPSRLSHRLVDYLHTNEGFGSLAQPETWRGRRETPWVKPGPSPLREVVTLEDETVEEQEESSRAGALAESNMRPVDDTCLLKSLSCQSVASLHRSASSKAKRTKAGRKDKENVSI